MAGRVENLHPFTVEEAREAGRKGGLASGKKKRDKRTLKQTLKELLEMPIPYDPEKRSGMECLAVEMLEKALSGDLKAMEAVRDTIGENPTSKSVTSGDERLIISWEEGGK